MAAPEDTDGGESEGSTNRSVESTPNQQTLSQYSDTGTAQLTSVCDVSSDYDSVSPDDTYRDEAWLRERYVKQEKSHREIADELGVNKNTIHNWLREHNIETRSDYPTFVERLGHTVDSEWEEVFGVLLQDNEIQYERESVTVSYTTVLDFEGNSSNTHTHTPDYVTDEYIIEIKGRNWGAEYEHPGTAERKAQATMNHIDDREYVVVGIELPCDHHYSYEEREDLLELFE